MEAALNSFTKDLSLSSNRYKKDLNGYSLLVRSPLSCAEFDLCGPLFKDFVSSTGNFRPLRNICYSTGNFWSVRTICVMMLCEIIPVKISVGVFLTWVFLTVGEDVKQ